MGWFRCHSAFGRLLPASAAALLALAGCPAPDSKAPPDDPPPEDTAPPDTGDTGHPWVSDGCIAWLDFDGDRYISFDAPCWLGTDGEPPDNYTDAWDTGDFRHDFYEECNDGDHSIFPWAPEIPYDGIDQDCHGPMYEFDHDYDRYNAIGYEGLDCADDSPEAHPGGHEWVGDLVDGDCDGVVDEPGGGRAVSLAESPTVVGDHVTAKLGAQVALIDVWGDGEVGLVAAQTAWDWSDELVVVPTIRDGTASEVALATVAGFTMSSPPTDVDADGADDLLLATRYNSAVILGPIDHDVSAADAVWTDDWIILSGLGDVTGDGVGDIGTYDEIVAGPITSHAETAGAIAMSSFSGISRAGDVDGDGMEDILLFTNHNPRVVLGPVTGDLTNDSLDGSVGQGCSWDTVAVGDADGDGRGDVACWVWYGDQAVVRLVVDPVGDGERTVDLRSDGLDFNLAIGTLGDTDGDGRNEVWVDYAGIVVFQAPFEANQSAFSDGVWVTRPTGLTWYQTAAGERDIDHDGLDDYVIGFQELADSRGAVVLGRGLR